MTTTIFGEIDAVIFDWDGVLVDSPRNYYHAYERTFREVGIAVSQREIYLREGQATPQLIAAICAGRGVDVSEQRIGELVERRRQHDVAIGPRTFYPGMLGLLDRLRGSGCKLAMVTGSSRRSVQRLLTPELESIFDVVITADDVRRSKPDPEPFRKAVEAMGVDSHRSVVVENAPFGVQAARATGCRVIALCTTLGREDLHDADCVIADHRELEGLLVPATTEAV